MADFIYRDEQKQKHISTLRNLQLDVRFSFTIDLDSEPISCTLLKEANGWMIAFNEDQRRVGLSDLEDIYWNSEAIGDYFGQIEYGNQLAYAIRSFAQHYRGLISYR